MAASKKEKFLTPEIRLSEWARGIAHHARIAILNVLVDRGECTCGEVVAQVPLAQATVSQHLKFLREAGLIRSRAEGARMYYRLDAQGLRAFRLAAQFFFARFLPGEKPVLFRNDTAEGPRAAAPVQHQPEGASGGGRCARSASGKGLGRPAS